MKRLFVAVAAHELRARWRGWAVLVALVAFAGGAVLAAARTEAEPTASRPADLAWEGA
jgi:hypothetical protein